MSAKLAPQGGGRGRLHPSGSVARPILTITPHPVDATSRMQGLSVMAAVCLAAFGPGAFPYADCIDIAEGLIALTLAAQLIRRTFRAPARPLDCLAGAWLASQAAGSAWGMHTGYYAHSAYTSRIFEAGPDSPLHHLGDVAAGIGLYFAVSRLPAGNISRTLLAVIAGSVGVIALAGIEEARNILFGTADPRIQATFSNPNLLGAFVCIALPLIAAWSCERGVTRPMRTLRAALGVLLAIVGILTQSRGAILGCAIALLYLALAQMRLLGKIGAMPSPVRVRIFLAGACIIALAGFALFPLLLHQSRSISDAQREAAWRGAVLIIAQYPITGLGDGSYPTALALLHLREPNPVTADGLPLIPSIHLHAHDLILQAWVERGLAGAAIALWLIGMTMRNALALLRSPEISRNTLPLGACAALIATLCQNIADYTLWYTPILLLFWLTLALDTSPQSADNSD